VGKCAAEVGSHFQGVRQIDPDASGLKLRLGQPQAHSDGQRTHRVRVDEQREADDEAGHHVGVSSAVMQTLMTHIIAAGTANSKSFSFSPEKFAKRQQMLGSSD